MVRMCKCGERPKLQWVPKQGKTDPYLFWYECRCGVRSGAALSKENALHSWNHGERDGHDKSNESRESPGAGL